MVLPKTGGGDEQQCWHVAFDLPLVCLFEASISVAMVPHEHEECVLESPGLCHLRKHPGEVFIKIWDIVHIIMAAFFQMHVKKSWDILVINHIVSSHINWACVVM